MQVDPAKTGPLYYEIQIAGRMSQEHADWFGLTMTTNPSEGSSSVTVLSGPVLDQAALFGILNRIRDLGLKLISVNRIEPDHPLDQEPG